MDDRDLEKLFQEELQDFRQAPEPEVWSRISSSLDKKKSRRVIPLWWRWGAAAAVLAGMLFLINPWENETETLPAVTKTEAESEKPGIDKEVIADPSGVDLMQPESDDLAGQDYDTSESSREKASSGASPNQKTENPVKIPSEDTINSENTLLVSGSPSKNISEKEQGVITEQEKLPLEAEVASRDNAIKNNPAERIISPETSGESSMETYPEQEQAVAVSEKPEKATERSIFEAIESDQEVAKSEVEGGKWLVGPSLAPVYFDSFGNGSPISPNFVNNSKSGSVNMSYGLQVAYKVSRKISIRSGIHRVDYGYNTNEVGFTSSPSARPSSLIRSISYSENSRSLVVHSTASGAQDSQQPTAVDISAPSAARQGQMVQEFGYLEVPVELQYTLIDKRWGVNLIGGMSSLFLMDNTVSLESSGTTTEVGESNNMNSLNFSTNLGFGVFYQLSPKLELNLLPMFKYQLNTFSETEGNFQPYSVGVYSGLSFRF